MNPKRFLVPLLLLCFVTGLTAQTSRRRPRRPTTNSGSTPSAPEASPTPADVAVPTVLVPLAVLNGQTITSADIDANVRQEVETIDGKLALARQQVIELQINTTLLESEAAKRRMTSQQLYELEVGRKIPAPTAAEIDKFIQENSSQLDQHDPQETRQQVTEYLKGERENKLSEDFIKRLRLAHPVVIVAPASAMNLPASAVIATVDGRPITAAMIEERLKPIVYKLRLNWYQLAKQALDLTINDMLLLAEATRRNVAPEEIVRKEITEKMRTPTEADVAKFFEENKARLGGDLPSLRNQIATYLEEKDRERLEMELSNRLRAGANIRMLLTEPPLPVQAISVDDDPAMGQANAPVTIVEFTDFQCPACAAMQPLLEEALKSYGPKVRLVVRDFPLDMHANARKAAEAANAANAQGKFFEYTSLLFKRQSALDVPSLKKYATELGLDRAKFDADLDTGKYAAEVKHDMNDGEMYGVDSTPAIFINGVALREMSMEALRASIDRGLAGTKVSSN